MSKTLWQHYLDMTRRMHDTALENPGSLTDWQSQHQTLHSQFMRSIGLDRLPPRSDLSPVKIGTVSLEGVRIEKYSWQILPGCYATGSVFYPDPLPSGKHSAILYCCGHSPIGVHYYAPHGVLWARRGYICLLFDTIQQQDNPGTHDALDVGRRYKWISMGYPGSGGEVFNSLRAFDFLASLPEVDSGRIGITGTSGGGSLSFLTAVAEPRIAAAASCCGVTSPWHTLANRSFQMHCDCMFVQNVYQHDTAVFAALVAPRPLLFCYGTHDAMFSHAEYSNMAERARRIFQLYGCQDNCQLCEYVGHHGYSPESIERINQWFDRHLAQEERPLLQLESLQLSEVEMTHYQGKPPHTNHLHLLPELLSPAGTVRLPASPEEWTAIRRETVKRLRHEVFHYQENDPCQLEVETVGVWDEGRLIRHRLSFDGMGLWMDVRLRAPEDDKVFLGVANARQNNMSMLHKMADFCSERNMVILEPRGTGVSSVNGTELDVDRDNFVLQAGTIAGMTPLMLIIQDLRNVVAFLRTQPWMAGKRLFLYGSQDAAVACVYQAAMDDKIAGVVAERLPDSHRQGGWITGILRILDLEQAIGLIAPRPVGIVNQDGANRNVWISRLFNRLGCPEHRIITCQSSATAAEKVVEYASE